MQAMCFPLHDGNHQAWGLPDKRIIGYGLFFGYPELQIKAIPRRNAPKIEWRG